MLIFTVQVTSAIPGDEYEACQHLESYDTNGQIPRTALFNLETSILIQKRQPTQDIKTQKRLGTVKPCFYIVEMIKVPPEIFMFASLTSEGGALLSMKSRDIRSAALLISSG